MPKVLFYDIETNLLKGLFFSLGKQVVRSNQLAPKNQYTKMISLSYCWNDGKPAKTIVFEEDKWDDQLLAFDKEIKKADVVIGKNSDRFDNKHINTHRLLSGNPGMPDWIKYTDDLERQFRRHFNLPSQALDYVSDLLGFGGKVKMEFSDWVNVFEYRELQRIEEAAGKEAAKDISPVLYNRSYSEINSEGRKAVNKFKVYGAKDVEDTRAIWEYAADHFTPKFNASVGAEGLACRHCGSDKIAKNGVRQSGQTRYQTFTCSNPACGHTYAGRAAIRANGKLGKMG